MQVVFLDNTYITFTFFSYNIAVIGVHILTGYDSVSAFSEKGQEEGRPTAFQE